MPPADWPRPLTLLAAFLRVDGSAVDEARVIAGALSTEDWQTFADLTIDQHRVANSVAEHLDAVEVPDPVRDRIGGAVRQNGLVTMAHLAETRRIHQALDAIDVELTVFKGWPLAERLYGRADGRHAGDLDLLVPEDRVADCRAALEGIGFQVSAHTAKFRRRLRGLENPQLIQACKDIEMVRPESGVAVEMHWRFLNYHAWPLFFDRPGALVTQHSAAGPLLVPDDGTNVLYLSTHGALHLWERFKWLEDIARLAQVRGQDVLARDIEEAREVGLLRPVAFALSLAGRLLASPMPPGLERVDPGVTGLVDWTIRRLARRRGRFAKARYQAGIRWMGLRLARDWHQRMGIIGYDITRRFRLASLDVAPGPRKPGKS